VKPKPKPIHLLTDWRYVQCRQAEQRGEISGSRSPHDVTCPKCLRHMRDVTGYTMTEEQDAILAGAKP
jgi:hypothetical protein